MAKKYIRRKMYTRRNTKRYIGGNAHTHRNRDRTYVFIIPYRARSPQENRKNELIAGMNSISEFFTKCKRKYKIIVVEQNNDLLFNMGYLKNIGFLEGEKAYTNPKVYLHFNVDYSIDQSREFPKELDEFDGNGILDICAADEKDTNKDYEGVPERLVGGCCCFNAKTFKKINGMTNKLFGYGFCDAAFRFRVDRLKVPYIRNTITNNGWIQVKDDTARDMSKFSAMQEKYRHERDSAPDNYKVDGLNSCKYTISGNGEFNSDSKNIKHLLAEFTMEGE